jgi:flagellar FliL protein
MAEEVEKAEDVATKGVGKKKLILMILLGVLLVAGSIGGTIITLKILTPEAEVTEVVDDVAVKDVKMPAIYYPIKPAIVANYDYNGRQRYAEVHVTLLIRDETVISAVELHSPLITNALVLTIGSQMYSEIQSAEGKELLRQQCLQELQKILEKEIGKPGIEQVLFTNFVMQ